MNKIKICRGESSETVYWLEITEGNEMLAIFTLIVRNKTLGILGILNSRH